jgi:hypothetical protein
MVRHASSPQQLAWRWFEFAATNEGGLRNAL